MAFLPRTRSLSKITKIASVATFQRPIQVRQMMAVPKAASLDRLEEILFAMAQQKDQMEQLQEDMKELKEQNERLRARVDDSDDEGESSGKIDRDAIEEKLDELEGKLDEAKDLVNEIREILQ
jgi:predicted transcriptional regulator